MRESFDGISEIIKEICGAEEINPELTLKEDLALDSMQMVVMLITLEDVFDIVLDESDMNPFDLITVQDIVDLVDKYLKEDKFETNN